VRRLVAATVGTSRGIAAAGALSSAYTPPLGFFVNFFQPSFKLASKNSLRAAPGPQTLYHAPQTAMAAAAPWPPNPSSEQVKDQGCGKSLRPLDPLSGCSTRIRTRATPTWLRWPMGPGPHTPPQQDDDPRAAFPLGARYGHGVAGRSPAPTHIEKPKRTHDWRTTREDPFESTWPTICELARVSGLTRQESTDFQSPSNPSAPGASTPDLPVAKRFSVGLKRNWPHPRQPRKLVVWSLRNGASRSRVPLR